MKLIIAEKPDQGSKLAEPFRHSKKQGYIEVAKNQLFPNGARITWAVGHLCELVPPEEYHESWKKWRLETLPILPDKFRHRVIRSKWKQFKVVKDLVHHPEVKEIIIAGDAGREGEAIIRVLLQQCNNRKPLKRLWISSLTANSVMNGFHSLLDEKDTRNLYYEALSRACADWLVGMNASRAYTLLLQQKNISDVFSTGRVQTPTLALIVKREKEIENFKSEPFWEVIAEFAINSNAYTGKWQKEGESRLFDKDKAEEIARLCQGKMAKIERVEKERKEYQSPMLFNLSSLQATANKLFKYSPKKTLDIAQKLYVKGIISYPRSDSSFVTKEEAGGFPDILAKIKNLSVYESLFPVTTPNLINNKRYVNDRKVTDHYAIIPTEQVTDPARLSADEQKVYDLIIRRLIAAHYHNAIVDYTTIHTMVDDKFLFLTKGKVEVEQGWKKVIFVGKEESDGDHPLPDVKETEEGSVEQIVIKEGKTQPPKRYTEGQLITLMKTAGKYLEDDELVKVLNKTEGLGTEATRAGIITILKERKYIDVTKNQVMPTEKGKLLIEAIGDSILASPEMTAKWEQRLHEIGEGKAGPKEFMEQAKKLSMKLIDDAKKQSLSWTFKNVTIENTEKTKNGKTRKKSTTTEAIGKCKKCDGNVVDKGKFFGCSNYSTTKCNFTLSKRILGKSITQTNAKKLLADGKTNLIKGFKKGDKTFNAKLEWKNDKVSFSFED